MAFAFVIFVIKRFIEELGQGESNMAEGRMLKKKISLNDNLADLDNDTHRLLFTWGLAHLDIEGRITGNPRVFKAAVAPLLDHLTSEKISKFFKDAYSKGLIIHYEINNEWWIQYPKFKENQNLRNSREAPSRIPPPPEDSGTTPGELQEDSGITPAEEKGSKEKGSKDIPPPKISEKKIKEQKPQLTPIPENFTISPAVKGWAAKKGHDRLDEHLEAFKRKVAMKGYEYIDWDSAFMEAVREDWAKLRYIKGSPAPVEYIPPCQTLAPPPPQPDPFCLKCGGKGEYPGEKEILNRIIKVRVRCTCLDQEEPR